MKRCRYLLAIALPAVVLMLSACASIVEGTDQSVRVNLSPKDATCIVMRDGEQIASVSRENQAIRIGKSKDDLEIECRAPGHLSENLAVESSASGWGVVGCIFIDLCITDYSTGALNKYPKQITIALAPENFRSEQERDAWIERRRSEINTGWDRRITEMKSQCADARDSEGCNNEVARLEKQKVDAVTRFERQIVATRISATAEPPASSIESRLKTVNDLFSRGIISREEYERKRQEIVSGI